MKELLKRLLPTALIRRVRWINRFRWVSKWRLLRFWGLDLAAHPWQATRYILFDPEIESYSYEIANEAELARFVAQLLGVSETEASGWIAEARTDSVLARDRGWSLTHKRRTPLGYRTAWYAVARGLKPRLVVEAGIHEGLGSEVLLRALQRNGEEGQPGTLMSFDLFADTGRLVSPPLRESWQRVHESTRTGLERALSGREAGLFIHDIQHVEEPNDFEFEVVWRHAAERLVMIDSIGGHPALREFCKRHGGSSFHFKEEPKGHFIQTVGSVFAVFDRRAKE